MDLILIIDDDRQVRRVIKEILVQEGFAVIEAQDGQEGIEACRRAQVNLVIMDLFMPKKEGLETIGELRREFPEVGVLAMSGYSANDALGVLNMAKKLGAHETIAKPFDIETFTSTIKNLLSQA